MIIEVQNVVDMPFIHRLQKYCSHVFESYNIQPIALTLCVNQIRKEIVQDFTDSHHGKFIQSLPCKYWAKENFMMTSGTIEGCLKCPMDPLVAMEYVFTQQKCYLFGLELKDDPTVSMLYLIAKEVLNKQIRIHEGTVDVLVDVCNQTQTIC